METETILKVSFEESLSDSSIKQIQSILKNSLGFNTKIEELENNNFFLCSSCQNSFKEEELNSSGLCEGCQLQDRE